MKQEDSQHRCGKDANPDQDQSGAGGEEANENWQRQVELFLYGEGPCNRQAEGA
jgi:hypothetical protein